MADANDNTNELQHQSDEICSDGDAAEIVDVFHDPQPLTVQSLPYVKCRESASAIFSFDSAARRRTSLTSKSTAHTYKSSSGNTEQMLASLSYSVPSTTMVTNTPRGRPAVDVIATYMNTCDQRTVKTDLMRARAHFASPRGTVNVVCILATNAC